MDKKKIAIIGTGHIGRALFEGLMHVKTLHSSQFVLTNHHPGKLNDLQKQYRVTTTIDNRMAVENSDVIIFCVKPKDLKQVLTEVRGKLNPHKLLISVAACITLDLLKTYLGTGDYQLIRIIPNIPVAFQEGIIGWLDNGKVKPEQITYFKSLFSRLGLLIRCPDDIGLEKLSMIAGCGIGYVAYFMKNLSRAAEKYGFSAEEARKITRTVFFSTIDHLKQTNQSIDELISSVATKGGITEEVLNNLDNGKFFELFLQSIDTGFLKVSNVTNELKKEV